MRWASFRSRVSSGVAGRPELPAGAGFPAASAVSAASAGVLGGPELLARLGLLHGDRRGRLDDALDRRASCACPGAAPPSRRARAGRAAASRARGRSPRRRARTCSSTSSSSTSMPSASATASTTSSRRTRHLGVRPQLLDDLLRACARWRPCSSSRETPSGSWCGGLLEDRADPPVDHHLRDVDRGRRRSTASTPCAAEELVHLRLGAPRRGGRWMSALSSSSVSSSLTPMARSSSSGGSCLLLHRLHGDRVVDGPARAGSARWSVVAVGDRERRRLAGAHAREAARRTRAPAGRRPSSTR